MGETILHLALNEEEIDLEIIRLLLDKKANPNLMENKNGNSAMHLYSTFDQLKLLIEYKGDPKIKNRLNKEPIDYCKNKEQIKHLIENKTEISRLNSFLHFYCKENDYKSVKFLLEHKIGVNRVENNMTPLHIALLNKQKEMIKVLVENKADINKFTTYSESPFYYFMKKKERMEKEMLFYLLDNKANPHLIKSQTIMNPFYLFLKNGFPLENDIFERLSRDYSSKKAQELEFIYAEVVKTETFTVPMMALWLQRGLKITLASKNDENILHVCVSEQREDLVYFLLWYVYNVYRPDNPPSHEKPSRYCRSGLFAMMMNIQIKEQIKIEDENHKEYNLRYLDLKNKEFLTPKQFAQKKRIFKNC